MSNKLNIKDKELTLKLRIKVDNRIYYKCYILAKAKSNSVYKLGGRRFLPVYPETIRHFGCQTLQGKEDQYGTRAGRCPGGGGVIAKQNVAVKTENGYKPETLVLLSTDYASLRKINNTPVERIWGLDINKWTFDQVCLRFNLELTELWSKLKGDPFVYSNSFDPINNNNVEDYVAKLRLLRNAIKTKNKKERSKEHSSEGINDLLGLCEVV